MKTGVLIALGACAGEVTASDSGPAQQEGDTRVLDDDDSVVSRNPTAGRRGPLPEGGAASCVESYAARAVTGRAFAFDGVVVEVGPFVSDRGDEADLGLPGVTFEVRK